MQLELIQEYESLERLELEGFEKENFNRISTRYVQEKVEAQDAKAS